MKKCGFKVQKKSAIVGKPDRDVSIILGVIFVLLEILHMSPSYNGISVYSHILTPFDGKSIIAETVWIRKILRLDLTILFEIHVIEPKSYIITLIPAHIRWSHDSLFFRKTTESYPYDGFRDNIRFFINFHKNQIQLLRRIMCYCYNKRSACYHSRGVTRAVR